MDKKWYVGSFLGIRFSFAINKKEDGDVKLTDLSLNKAPRCVSNVVRKGLSNVLPKLF